MNEQIETSVTFDYLKNCIDIRNRFSITEINNITISSTCCKYIYLDNSYEWLSNLINTDVYITYYYNGYLTPFYKVTIESVVDDHTLVLADDIQCIHPSNPTLYSANNIINKLNFVGSASGITWNNYVALGENIGTFSVDVLTFTINVEYIRIRDSSGNPVYPESMDLYIGGTSTTPLIHANYQSDFGSSTYTRQVRTGSAGLLTVPLTIIVGQNSFHSISCTVEYSINIVVTDCRGETHTSNFTCIPASPASSNYFVLQLVQPANAVVYSGPPANVTILGNASDPGDCPHSSNGAQLVINSINNHTLLFETNAYDCWDASINYQLGGLSCDSLFVLFSVIALSSLYKYCTYTDENLVIYELIDGAPQTFLIDVTRQ
jgi:hypothetical protein